MTAPIVTNDQIEEFERNGVVCLRGLIPGSWIARLQDAVEADLRAPGADVEIYTSESDPGLFFNDFDMWRHIPEFEKFAFEGPCADVAGALMHARNIHLFYDHLFVKEPGTTGLTHWHQDQPYLAVEGQQFCSNWIPLDPISRETTLEFIAGSHGWNRWFAPFDSMRDGTRHASTVFERCPDIEAARDDYDIISWELEPGDCLFFRGLILHQGRNNPTRDTRRRVLAHRWLGDDITYIERDPPAEFPKVPTHLKTGDSYDKDPQFPRVRENLPG